MKPTLVIAEAEGGLRDTYRAFFKFHNYETTTAVDGLDCLTKVRLVKPVVLILDTDLQWGGCDGVLAVLREDDDIPPLPVILTTTGETKGHRPELVKPPVVRYFRKPFSLKLLLECVRAARVDRRRHCNNGIRPCSVLNAPRELLYQPHTMVNLYEAEFLQNWSL